MDFDPNRVYQQITEAGETWADRNAAADMLEETKKSVLAELMNQAQGSSSAAKEIVALADPVYRLHLTNMVTARKEANKARVIYDAMKVLAELRRSQEATRRSEMNLK
jgi:hypothetical protein